ncbi:MAG: hypothetical protein ACPK7O_06820 [Methanobacterium sp.]
MTKFNPKQIEQDSQFKEFLRDRPVGEKSKKEYVHRMRLFCNFVGKSPYGLIKEAEKEEDIGIRMKNRKIRKYLYDFRDHLKEEDKSINTISSCLSTIKGFYSTLEVEVPRCPIATKTEINRSLDEKIPTKEHIRQAITTCNPRNKAIILLMSSSGFGASETVNLTYGDFLKAISEYMDYDETDINKIAEKLKNRTDLIGVWRTRRYKTQRFFSGFSSPESTIALIDYLQTRVRKYGDLKKESSLFDSYNFPMSKEALIAFFERLNDNLEWGFVGKQRFFRSHALRKYFTSTCYAKGMEYGKIKLMLAHKLSRLDGAYFKINVDDLKKDYMKVIEDLSIEKIKVKKVTTPEYDELLKDSKIKDKEINLLRAQIKKQEERHKTEMAKITERVDHIEERGNEVRELGVDDFKLYSELNMKLAENSVPADAENREELVDKKYMELMMETWDKLPLIKRH